MKETVSEEVVADKALKRDGYCCSSCGLTPADTLLEVVWTIDQIQAKDRTLRNAITLCIDCCAEPLPFRLRSSALYSLLNIQQLSTQKYQLDQYQRVERKKAVARKKIAKAALEDLTEGHKWKDDEVRGAQDFIAKLGIERVQNAVGIALSKAKNGTPDERFKYFCDVCWNRIRET
jgi:hypothetical protein